MTMKKKILSVVLAAVLLLSMLTGCGRSLNSVIGKEPNFTGTVLEVCEGSILVEADEGEDIRRSGDLAYVSLDVEFEDGLTSYSVGDRVTVYYDGSVAESDPLQVTNVYAILLIEPANRDKENAG